MHAGVFVAQNIYLCPGDHFSKMCSTNYSYLLWNVDIPHENHRYGIPVPMYSSNSHTGTIRNTGYESIRNSERGELPITSTLLFNSVTSNINGALIYCTGFINFNRHTTPATLIHVINGTSLATLIR